MSKIEEARPIFFRKFIATVVIIGTMGWTGLAWSGSVVAIVEEIKADGVNVAFMDYLIAGRTIALGKKGRLVSIEKGKSNIITVSDRIFAWVCVNI